MTNQDSNDFDLVSEDELNELDKYRRQLNKEFAQEIHLIVESDAELSDTDSSNESESENKNNG